MTTASNNGATRATCLVMEGQSVMFTKDTPIGHAPRVAVIPSGTTVTAWLRDNARHGATLVTRNGVTVAEIGHAVRMKDSDGRMTRPYFATEVTEADTLARFARVNIAREITKAYEG